MQPRLKRVTALSLLLNLALILQFSLRLGEVPHRGTAPATPVHLSQPLPSSYCPGTAPGSWASSNEPGSRWQLLDSNCQLKNFLQAYRSNANAPPLKLLALSDSVDRFLFNFTCQYLGGTYASAQPPNNDPALNKRAYLLHSCRGISSKLKLASTYIPGIHPYGPFHANIVQAFPARIDYAKEKWQEYADGPPDVVIVASNLWDIARISGRERHLLRGQEFSAATLRQWMANYTAAVNYVRKTFPEAKAYVYHTTLAPRISSLSGAAAKPYLGYRNHVAQLNAAGVTAARALGMRVVDYVPVGARLYDGQEYLYDLIHPRQDVCLELANVYFNLGMQVLAAS